MSQAIAIGSRATEMVDCSKCKKAVAVNERHSYQGKNKEDIYFCDTCIVEINTELEEQTKNPNMIGATLLGLAASIIGIFVWSLFTILTKWEVGYIAIGVGWLVGQAVCFGSGHKRGPTLQLIAVAWTAIAILLSEIVLFTYFVSQQESVNPFALLLGVLLSGQFIPFVIAGVQAMISPMSLLIWGIGLWTAYRGPQAAKLPS